MAQVKVCVAQGTDLVVLSGLKPVSAKYEFQPGVSETSFAVGIFLRSEPPQNLFAKTDICFRLRRLSPQRLLTRPAGSIRVLAVDN